MSILKIENTNEIAEFLKLAMKEKKITANKLLTLAREKKIYLGRNQIYSVLQMGVFKNKNYTIESLLCVIDLIGVNLTIEK